MTTDFDQAEDTLDSSLMSNLGQTQAHRVVRVSLAVMMCAAIAVAVVALPEVEDEFAAAPAAKVAASSPDPAGQSVEPAVDVTGSDFGDLPPQVGALTASGLFEDDSEEDEEPTTTTAKPIPTISPESEWIDSGNGVLVPDVLLRIRFCESTNNYKAAHKVSSASGAYQFIDGTWDFYGYADKYGTDRALDATPAEQDAAAVATIKGPDKLKPWAASQDCWANPNINSRYRTVKPPVVTTTTIAPTTTEPPATAAPTTVPPATTPPTTAPESPTTTEEPTTTETTEPPATTEAPASTEAPATTAQPPAENPDPGGDSN